MEEKENRQEGGYSRSNRDGYKSYNNREGYNRNNRYEGGSYGRRPNYNNDRNERPYRSSFNRRFNTNAG